MQGGTDTVQAGDQDASYERVDIAEAATRLQTTPEAIRKRIRRGSLEASKQDGRWYVVLDVSRTASSSEGAGRPGDGVQDTGQDASRTELVDALKDEILFLRRELEQRSEEIQRRDVIIAQLTDQLRRLPAPEPEAFHGVASTEEEPTPARPEQDLTELLRAQADAMTELYRDLAALRLQFAKVEASQTKGAEAPKEEASHDGGISTEFVEKASAPWWRFWRRNDQ
jgi:hypothetical protein